MARKQSLLFLLVQGLLVAGVLLVPAPAGAQQFPSNDDLTVMLRYLVEDGEAPAIVLGILESDGSTRVVSYGNGGAGTRQLGPRSLFEIGSVTKTFTGVLLAEMVAKKEVALADPLSKYLPAGVKAPSRDGVEITLLDLATHFSGLPRLPDNQGTEDPADPYAAYTVEKLYAFLSSHQLRRVPGAQYEYSNLGVGLLGHLLARAAGRTYLDLMRERILGPLGMTMTGGAVGGDAAAWMVNGHTATGDRVPLWTFTEAIQGAGALRSNAEDMLKYLKANVGAPQTDLQRAMRVAHEARRPFGDQSVGLAWTTVKFQGRTLVRHSGSTAGFSSLIAFDPDRRAGFVMLTNAGDFGDDIGEDFLRRGLPFAMPVVAVGRSTLERYVGTYEIAPGRNAVVRLERDGTLTFQAPGNVRFQMYAESPTAFYMKRAPWRVSFPTNTDGVVTNLVADLEGRVITAPKTGIATPNPAVVAGNAAEEVPIAANDMAQYNGTYAVQVGPRTTEFRVFVQDGRLLLQAPALPLSRLFHKGKHEFQVGPAGAVRLVFTVENGRAVAMTVLQNGKELPGKRRP